jgi:hypothetical protein
MNQIDNIMATSHDSNEPVAWVLEWSYNGDCVGRRLYDDETHCKFDAGQDGGICRPLIHGDTAPQPKQWVGLTKADRIALVRDTPEPPNPNDVGKWVSSLITATEAKLREKNTAPQPQPDDTALLRKALDLIEAWERGASSADYWREIADLKERLKL